MSPSAYTAIKSFLAGLVTPVLDFDEINPTLEQGADPFYCLEEGYSYERTTGFGDSVKVCMEESGGFTVHCFVRAPESSTQARANAEALRPQIRFQKLLEGMLDIQECDPPELVMLNDGLWTDAVVNVSYVYQYSHTT